MANIDIPGRLHSIATGNIVAGADEIQDDNLSKTQSQVNSEVYGLVQNINDALENLNPEQQEALSISEKVNNNEAKLGYYVCTTKSNVATKTIVAPNYILSSGGSIKIKMEYASSISGATLNINSTGPKALLYNGDIVSPNNTWEDGEVIFVYYDPSANDGTGAYYASNSQGGGGKGKAEKIKYDNSQSGLAADNVQEALDEIDSFTIEDNLYWQRQITFPINGFITGTGTWFVSKDYTHAHFSAEGVKFIKIAANETNFTVLAFLRTYTVPGEDAPDLCCDVINLQPGEIKTLKVPDDCSYIVVSMMGGTNNYAPQYVYVGRHIDENAEILTAKEGALRQKYAGCKLCIIGDSISTYNGDVPTDATYHYPGKGITSLDEMYYKRLVDNLGFTSYQNLSYGGSGVIRYDNSPTHPSLFERLAFIENADVVIIELSVNDFGHQVAIGTPDYDSEIGEMDELTFYNAYIKGLKELMRRLPEAQIVLMLTEEVIDTDDSQYPIKMKDYQDAVRNIASHYGLTIIDASHAYSTYGYMVHGSGDIHPRFTEMELLYYSCINSFLDTQSDGEKVKYNRNVVEYLTPIDFNVYLKSNFYMDANGRWTIRQSVISTMINIKPGMKYRVKAKTGVPCPVYIMSVDNRAAGNKIMTATGYSLKKAIVAPEGGSIDFISPTDGHFLFITFYNGTADRTPQSISIVNEVTDVSEIKKIADDYFSKGSGKFQLGGASIIDGSLDNTNDKLGRTDMIACSGVLNISVNIPEDISIDGAFLLKYNEGLFVGATELDVTNLNYSIKADDFTHAILRLYNSDGYTFDQWSAIAYSYTTGMKHLIGDESDSIEDKRIDYVRSIQTKTKVLEIEEQEMIPTKGVCITSYGGKLYCSIDGVKYEINKTQI